MKYALVISTWNGEIREVYGPTRNREAVDRKAESFNAAAVKSGNVYTASVVAHSPFASLRLLDWTDR